MEVERCPFRDWTHFKGRPVLPVWWCWYREHSFQTPFVIMQNPLGCSYNRSGSMVANPNIPPTSTWFLTISLLRKKLDQYGDTKKTTKIVLPFWELTYPFTLWHFSGPMIFRRNPMVGYVYPRSLGGYPRWHRPMPWRPCIVSKSFPWKVSRYFCGGHGMTWEPHIFNLDFLWLTDPFFSG